MIFKQSIAILKHYLPSIIERAINRERKVSRPADESAVENVERRTGAEPRTIDRNTRVYDEATTAYEYVQEARVYKRREIRNMKK